MMKRTLSRRVSWLWSKQIPDWLIHSSVQVSVSEYQKTPWNSFWKNTLSVWSTGLADNHRRKFKCWIFAFHAVVVFFFFPSTDVSVAFKCWMTERIKFHLLTKEISTHSVTWAQSVLVWDFSYGSKPPVSTQWNISMTCRVETNICATRI